MVRNEAKTIGIIRNGLLQSYPGSFYTKIPDQGALLKFGIERPFDILHTYNGTTTAIEAKCAKHPAVFKLSSVKTHQIDNLLSMANNQSTALVAIHLWMPSKLSYIHFLDIYDFLYWKEHSYSDSIKWNKFDDNPNISFSLDVKSKRIVNQESQKQKRIQYIDFSKTYIHI